MVGPTYKLCEKTMRFVLCLACSWHWAVCKGSEGSVYGHSADGLPLLALGRSYRAVGCKDWRNANMVCRRLWLGIRFSVVCSGSEFVGQSAPFRVAVSR